MSPPPLLDNSAWARLSSDRLSAERVEELSLQFEAGELSVSLPFLLEAGYSAKGAQAYDEMLDELMTLNYLAIDQQVEARALGGHSQLAQSGHHRIPPADLLLAAIADRHETGILHYDHDFDLIRDHTDLRFGSIWLAEPGSL